MKRALLLAFTLVLAPVVMAGLCEGYTETVLSDGTFYDYETFGTDHGTYRATIHRVVSDVEVLYVSTVLEGYNVTEISADAFADCISSKAIVIPERVTAIGENAFAGCTALERLYFLGDAPNISGTLPIGVTLYTASGSSGWDTWTTEPIEEYIVTSADGSSVTYFIIEGEATAVAGVPSSDGSITVSQSVEGYPVLSIGPYSFSGTNNASNTGIDPRTDIKKVIIPAGVTTIRERAFYYNRGITQISLPSGLTVIMDEAFRAASSMGTVDMPSSLTYIGFEAFRDCASMDAIDIPDAVTFIGEGAFKICRGAETIHIGTGVTETSPWVFAYCSGATSVEIKGEMTTLGLASFYMCTSLRSISLPDTVTTIGSDSFYYCLSLESVYLGKSLTTIGRNAFSECPVLNNVVIPGTVSQVQYKAFAYCPGLTDIYFEGEMPVFGDSVFLNNVTTVHCISAYADSWADFDGVLVVDGEDNNITTAIVIAIAVLSVCIIAVWFIIRRKG